MSAPSPTEVVIEIVGEGVTDVARIVDVRPVRPESGVVSILLHRLCDSPTSMRLKRKPFQFLQGRTLEQKTKFFKRNASCNGSSGCVMVMDTEGEHPKVLNQLKLGRDAELPAFPMAVGVAHECIEAWLLADASAIRRGIGLNEVPIVTTEPEMLSVRSKDQKTTPKKSLAEAAGSTSRLLSAEEKSKIAIHINIEQAESRCPSFAAFSAEVRQHIGKLFPLPIPDPNPDESAIQPQEGDATEDP